MKSADAMPRVLPQTSTTWSPCPDRQMSSPLPLDWSTRVNELPLDLGEVHPEGACVRLPLVYRSYFSPSESPED